MLITQEKRTLNTQAIKQGTKRQLFYDSRRDQLKEVKNKRSAILPQQTRTIIKRQNLYKNQTEVKSRRLAIRQTGRERWPDCSDGRPLLDPLSVGCDILP